MTLSITPDIYSPLYSKRLLLEVVQPAHADFISECYANDTFMNAYRLSQPRYLKSKDLRKGLARQQNKLSNVRNIEWVIKRKSDDNRDIFLGLVALADFSPQHNRAEFLIGFLQPKNARASLGLEASLLVLEFAFQRIELHKLICLVYAFNDSAQSNALHLGFSQEAFFREHYFNPHQHKFIDLYQNGLLACDFFASPSLSRWSKRLLGRDITSKNHSFDQGRVMSKSEIAENFERLLNSR